MITNFGYSIENVSVMPEILSEEEFNSMTANKFALDGRVADTIKSVTASIRNYCGWHIAPQELCVLVLNSQDLRISGKYCDINIQLPYRYVNSIEKVIINAKFEDNNWIGDEVEFNFNHLGFLTLYDTHFDSRRSNVVIFANAGISDTDALKGLIANKVSNVLSGTYGIQSESAGGVSITYNSNFVNGSKPNCFMTDDKELLNSYKLIDIL